MRNHIDSGEEVIDAPAVVVIVIIVTVVSVIGECTHAEQIRRHVNTGNNAKVVRQAETDNKVATQHHVKDERGVFNARIVIFIFDQFKIDTHKDVQRDNDIVCHGSHTPTKLHVEVHATQVNTPISTFRFHFTRDIAQGQAEHRRITAFVHTVTGPAEFVTNGAPVSITWTITVHVPGFMFDRKDEIERLQRHTRLLLGLGCGLAVCLLRLGVAIVVLLRLTVTLLRLGIAVVVLLRLAVSLLRLSIAVVVLLRLAITLLRLGIAVVILLLTVTLLRLGIAVVVLLLTICK